MEIRKDWKFLYLAVLGPALAFAILLVHFSGGDIGDRWGQIFCVAITITFAYDAFKKSEAYPIPRGGFWKALLVIGIVVGVIGLPTLSNITTIINSLLLVIYLVKVWKIRKQPPGSAASIP